jgi:hypothetical protein
MHNCSSIDALVMRKCIINADRRRAYSVAGVGVFERGGGECVCFVPRRRVLDRGRRERVCVYSENAYTHRFRNGLRMGRRWQ